MSPFPLKRSKEEHLVSFHLKETSTQKISFAKTKVVIVSRLELKSVFQNSQLFRRYSMRNMQLLDMMSRSCRCAGKRGTSLVIPYFPAYLQPRKFMSGSCIFLSLYLRNGCKFLKTNFDPVNVINSSSIF